MNHYTSCLPSGLPPKSSPESLVWRSRPSRPVSQPTLPQAHYVNPASLTRYGLLPPLHRFRPPGLCAPLPNLPALLAAFHHLICALALSPGLPFSIELLLSSGPFFPLPQPSSGALAARCHWPACGDQRLCSLGHSSWPETRDGPFSPGPHSHSSV